MKQPISWEAFLTLSLLLTMNKSVTFKFNLLLSLIMHTFSSGYLISIRSLSTPFARLVAGDPLTVGCFFDGFRPILETDLRRLLIACNLKSCELDPLSTIYYC